MTAENTMAGHYRPTGPTPGGARTGGTSTYSALLAQVKAAGLLRRRRGFYWTLFAGLVLATAACWVV
ncbi:acyl-CoA desaturase, partial [Curtobacterium citreum]|nr:acyl-CoA desaturase [Curtobacterium citreum]